MKILVIEDDAFYAQRLNELLLDLGMEGKIVSSAEAALAHNIDDYGGAIIDVMLPNNPDESLITHEETRFGFLTGIAVSRRLKKRKDDFPIIIISGGSSEGQVWAKDNNIPFVLKENGPKAMKQCLRQAGLMKDVKPRAFIVHGHDKVAVEELKAYIQDELKWQKPVVLRDEPSSGKTIIEKFEEYASAVDYVFVLMTPDDLVPDKTGDKRRSRQNVIFELGFFYGQFGRKSGKVIVLYKGSVELPSDIQGVAWIDISGGIKAAGENIRKELEN